MCEVLKIILGRLIFSGFYFINLRNNVNYENGMMGLELDE